jgi:hypothetical protein
MNSARIREEVNKCAGLLVSLLESQPDFSVSWNEHHFNAVSMYSAFQVSFQDEEINIGYRVKTDYHNHDGSKTTDARQEIIVFKPALIDASSGAWIYLAKPNTITKKVILKDGTEQVSDLSQVMIALESEERSKQFGLLIKKLGLLLRAQ